MAIAVDATSSVAGSTASSVSWNHTITGSNTILFVGYLGGITADLVTGITYNGAAFTKIGSSLLIPGTNGRWIALWYLINPAVGTTSITITNSASEYTEPFAVSYTGAKQSGQPDNNTSGTAGGTTDLTLTLTTVANNCWTIMMGTARGTNSTAGAGTTSRIVNAGGGGLYDSNAAITPAGSTSLVLGATGNDDRAAIMASFSPVGGAAAATLPYRSLLGVGI